MQLINSNLLNENIKKYPKQLNTKLTYAVSGLRNKGSILKNPVFRAGIIACLRSKQQNGKAIGLMITASHNPSEDNGVKIIDPFGDMLDKEWVNIATEFINLDDNQLEQWLINKINELNCNQHNGLVFIAKDTRESSDLLANAASDGIRSINGEFTDFGYLTTPQLHYIVNCKNTNSEYGEPSEIGYYKKYSKSFNQLIQISKPTKNYENILCIDCANGVGSIKMNSMIGYLESDLKINLINNGDGILNLDCGADYVKIEQRPPKNLELKTGVKYASFDGDADRIVYFYLNSKTNSFKLLDGDKISVLFAIYINKILDKLNLKDNLEVSIVQTAYANGSSTDYINNKLGMKTYCVATGVLNLQNKASQCDIGIYFEANGHGTILFSKKVISILKDLEKNNDLNAKELLLFIDLINQTAGDAISDLLAIEFILKQLDWSIHQWSEIYDDLPQKQLKVKVNDRTKIKITDDERRCIEPIELQNEIDKLILNYGQNCRSFVRPSQTEDIVRVYAESNNQELTNQLANEIANKVKQFVN